MPQGVSFYNIPTGISRYNELPYRRFSINPESETGPVTSAPALKSDETEIDASASNKMLEKYTFKKDEIKRNKKYSLEKIALSQGKNAQQKQETAALSVNKKSGYVQINLKKDITVKELKQLYNIQDGILKHYNELYCESDENGVESYDNGVLKKGSAVIIPPSSFEYQGRLKEIYNALVN